MNIRVVLNNKSEKIGSKIRQAELNKINIMLIVGEKEKVEKTVSLRRRFDGDIGKLSIIELKEILFKEIKDRGITHS
jgi:threonyl-tRNA synthetase